MNLKERALRAIKATEAIHTPDEAVPFIRFQLPEKLIHVARRIDAAAVYVVAKELWCHNFEYLRWPFCLVAVGPRRDGTILLATEGGWVFTDDATDNVVQHASWVFDGKRERQAYWERTAIRLYEA